MLMACFVLTGTQNSSISISPEDEAALLEGLSDNSHGTTDGDTTDVQPPQQPLIASARVPARTRVGPRLIPVPAAATSSATIPSATTASGSEGTAAAGQPTEAWGTAGDTEGAPTEDSPRDVAALHRSGARMMPPTQRAPRRNAAPIAAQVAATGLQQGVKV